MTDSVTEDKPPLLSVLGDKCLSKCYKKGEYIFHPRTLQIDKFNDSRCATEPRLVDDQRGVFYRGTRCDLNDNATHRIPNEQLVLLSYYFDPNFLLTYIYKLMTFNDVITWTNDNTHLPFNTIKRVHNCAWKIFGMKQDNITDIVLKYYYNIATKRWMDDYIGLLSTEFSFDIKYNISDDISSIKDIIIKKFFNYDFFVSIIVKYITVYHTSMVDIDSHYKKLKNFIYEQLHAVIKKEMVK